MKINGTPQPGRYRKLGGGKHTRGGCLATIAVPVVALLAVLVAALTTG